jgi:uncharacterized protein (TIGR02118 family)
MFKAVITLRRRGDMTHEQFADWWLGEHAPRAAGLPGVRRICFNLVEQGDGVEADGISELWFDSREAFDAAYADEIGKAVAADSMAHVQSRTRVFVVEHEIV